MGDTDKGVRPAVNASELDKRVVVTGGPPSFHIFGVSPFGIWCKECRTPIVSSRVTIHDHMKKHWPSVRSFAGIKDFVAQVLSECLRMKTSQEELKKAIKGKLFKNGCICECGFRGKLKRDFNRHMRQKTVVCNPANVLTKVKMYSTICGRLAISEELSVPLVLTKEGKIRKKSKVRRSVSYHPEKLPRKASIATSNTINKQHISDIVQRMKRENQATKKARLSVRDRSEKLPFLLAPNVSKSPPDLGKASIATTNTIEKRQHSSYRAQNKTGEVRAKKKARLSVRDHPEKLPFLLAPNVSKSPPDLGNASNTTTNTIEKQHSSNMASHARSSFLKQTDKTDALVNGESREVQQEHDGVYMACPTKAERAANAECERTPKLTGLYGLLGSLVSSTRCQSECDCAFCAKSQNQMSRSSLYEVVVIIQ